MNKFVLLSDKDKRAFFETAAVDLNLMPQLIEKDFWVYWILEVLFSLKGVSEYLTFKGGTSLSKCYNLIQRFSEDIDISIERSFLSNTNKIEPDQKESNKENQKRLKELQLACQSSINKKIIPRLRQAIALILSNTETWEIKLDLEDETGQTVLFTFPQAMSTGPKSYVKSTIKIEFGARSDHWPVETSMITPYVANASAKLNMNGASVRVLAAERTFWEKATILHMIYHYPFEKNVPSRMSRHYYDLFAMANSSVYEKALKSISLLKDVSEHKALFFKANWAHYEEARSGTLRLAPRDNQLNQLKNDYRQMQEMFFEKPPIFENIIKKLQVIEDQINQV